MELARAVLMNIGAVCKVFMRYSHMQVIATEDSDSYVKRHLIDFDSLTDGVDVEQEKAVVKQSIGVSVVTGAKHVASGTHTQRFVRAITDQSN